MQFTADTGITESAYDPTPGSATREQANAWLRQYAQNATAPVVRDDDGNVQYVYRQDTNISSVWVDLFDLKTSYTLNTNDWGTFAATFQATYYDTYEYEGLFGGRQAALGLQNADTGIVPPLPQYKANLRVNWFRDNQSASIAVNYWDDVEFDGVAIDRYRDGWEAPNTIEGEARTDVRYAIILDDYLDSEFTVSVGVNNIFNERPQQLPISGGFESRLSTPWGRQFWGSIEWRPGF
jgi:hypothetical protein